jgi:hypothetical protein
VRRVPQRKDCSMDDTTTRRPDLETVRNPHTDYESRDLSVRVIGLVGAGLAFFLAISPVALLLGFHGIGADVNRELRISPPQPRLQTDPARDLRAELTRQRTVLDSYGWVDRAQQTVRVPISVAMKHVVADGLDGFPRAPSQDVKP